MYPSPILSLNSLCAISLTRFLIDISSAADNTILKNRAQNIECSFGCLARSTVLLKPNVANILLLNFCKQKLVQHSPITIAIDCNDLSLDQNPHQTVTRFGSVGFSMYVCAFSVLQMRQLCLFTYPPRSK